MIKSAAKKAYLALIFLILYAPIFTLVILSFNNTKTRSRWDGFTGKLTSSKWAKITKTSQATALRDITDLISKGVLVAAADGGRSANYLLKDDTGQT